VKKFILILSAFLLLSLQLWGENISSRIGEKGPQPVPPEFRDVEDKKITVQPLAKKEVEGDTTFMIRKDIYGDNADLKEIGFYRKSDTSEIVNVFVETSEYDNGEVTDQKINDIVTKLAQSTPEGSINPSKGIYANMKDTLGAPSDVDKNGKLNVLLLDVRDGYGPEDENHVAGYFDPIDLKKNQGNYGEIIYIDTDPTDITNPSTYTIVAHELQHLIHYTFDTDEKTWLNEGISVLMPRILGLPYRSYNKFISSPNRKLNAWDNENKEGVLLKDYQKVGLWSFYLYKRFGIDFIADCIHEQEDGFATYPKIGSVSSKNLLKEWFIANLINDTSIDDGKYSYQGKTIPEINTDHFYSNYTEGKEKKFYLQSTAAQYIQFYEGQGIDFNLEHDKDDNFAIAVIKHKQSPQVSLIDPDNKKFDFSDINFGLNYNKVSFVPFQNSLGTVKDSIEISYKASGEGGVEETEIVHDGDSVSFYISLQGKEAAEKFQMPEDGKSLVGVKFKPGNKISDGTVRIYKNLKDNPVHKMENLTAAKSAWKKINFEEDILNEARSFAISVTLDGSLGYSATGNGEGKSYLSTASGFRNITGFTVGSDNDIQLDGNWCIRAIINKSTTNQLAFYPDSFFVWNNDKRYIDTNFVILNRIDSVKNWKISSEASWVNFPKKSGTLSRGADTIKMEIDKSNLKPGLYKEEVTITHNNERDSLYISMIKRNKEAPQSVCYLSGKGMIGDETRKMKLFNIGTGKSKFKFVNKSPSLTISPQSGYLEYKQDKNRTISDTISAKIFIDSSIVSQQKLYFGYYNGVDTVQKSINYEGNIGRNKKKYAIKLFPPAPNPLNKSQYSQTTLRFRLKKKGEANLLIYNILGQKIKKYDLAHFEKGMHSVRWYGKNEKGIKVSSGIYLAVLKQGGEIDTKKMLLIK